MPYKIRKTKCKKSDGSSGTHVVYKKSGKRVGCTDEPEDYKKALYAAEVNEVLILEDTLYKNVEDDVFLHFTLRDRAYRIREMGELLRQPEGIEKFGTDTIDAVSLIWGDFVPKVQTNHLGDEDIVAIIFKTDVPPKYGYVEEVKWDIERLPIYDVRIVPFEEAVQMLRNAPEHVDEMDYVLYKENKQMNIEDLSAIIQEEIKIALEEAKKKKKKKKKKKSKKKKGKDDRCTRIAKRKYDVWPCVPLHTEALTRKGWVVYEDLNVGDEILSYDRTSDTLKWTPVKNVHFFDDAEVFSIQKQHHKIECTMNHKWLTLSRAYKKQFQERNHEKRSTARQYFGLIQDVVSGKATLTEAREETGSTNFRHFVKKYKGLNFFEFCQEAKVARGAIANLKELGEINFKQESLLTAAPLDSSYPPSDIGVVGKYSDNWIEKILSMSYEQVKAFFASAIIYDGHQSRDLNTEDRARHSCNSYTFKQKDEMHSDIFELAAFLAGYNVQRGVKSSNGCTNFSIRENRFVSLEVAKLVEEPVQSVWCPETQYGTWVMRQNGRIMISGNSAYASGAVVQCRRGKIWKGLTEELNEAAGEGDIEQKLSQLAKGDQELRQIWAVRMKERGGWSEELVDEFAKEYGTDKEDLFGDHSRQEEFKKLFNMMSDADYNNFSDQNWDDFHIIVQHMDKDIDIQKEAREVLKRHNRTEQYQYLDDRINCAEFGKQLYGTQNGCEKVDTLQERRWKRNIWKGLTEEKEITPKDKETISDIVAKLRAASESHAQMAKDLEDGAAKLEKGSEAHSSQADKLEKMIQERKKKKKKKKKKAKKKVKTDFSKEKDKGLHGWFERQGGKGKSKGWVDCNTCRTDKKTGKKTCKSCGRQKGEKRAKYPSCRPTPAACGTAGKGKSWGKKSAKKGKKK